MRLYALRNEACEEAGILACLECYERPRAFYFELSPQADPWDLPFVLHEHAMRGQLTIGALWSLRWVRTRIVPRERQNLGEILRVNGLSAYDEGRLIDLTRGRCSQDDCYLTDVGREGPPDWYADRLKERLTEAVALSHLRMVVMRHDGEALLCDVGEELGGRREFAPVVASEDRFCRMSLQPGGHGVQWGERLHVSASTLTSLGTRLPLGADDVAAIASQSLCDTREAANILGCTRQNVADLVRRGKLVPVRTGARSMLFLRRDVLARRT